MASNALNEMFNGGAGFVDSAKIFAQSRLGMGVIAAVIIAIIISIILVYRKEDYIGASMYDSRAMYGDHGYMYQGTQADIGPGGDNWADEFANNVKKKQGRRPVMSGMM